VVLQYEVTDQGGGTKRYKAGAASTDGLHAVAVGYPGLLRVSADGGDSWASVSTWPAVGDSAAFGTVVFDTTGNSRNFIAWADYDFMSSFPMAVSSSNPANTWANRNSTNTRSVYAVDMAADSLFAYFGQAINVSDGGFIPPGVLRWTSELDYLTGEILGFTSSPSILVAVGATNKAWWRNRASGSKTWTQVATPVYQLNDVAYGNGVFAAVGNNSGAGTQMVYSQDGQTWSAATCNGSASSCVPLQTVTWNPQWGLFTAYGSLLTQYVSLDGRNWVTLPMPSQNGNGTPSEYIDAVNLGSSVLLIEEKGYIVRLSKLVPTH
jgi:hypothetical protein